MKRIGGQNKGTDNFLFGEKSLLSLTFSVNCFPLLSIGLNYLKEFHRSIFNMYDPNVICSLIHPKKPIGIKFLLIERCFSLLNFRCWIFSFLCLLGFTILFFSCENEVGFVEQCNNEQYS